MHSFSVPRHVIRDHVQRLFVTLDERPDFLGSDVRSQLDPLVSLVALIGVGVTSGPLASLFAGLVCAGIAAITFERLYEREFR